MVKIKIIIALLVLFLLAACDTSEYTPSDSPPSVKSEGYEWIVVMSPTGNCYEHMMRTELWTLVDTKFCVAIKNLP